MGISRRTILKLASVAPLAKIAGVSVASAQDRQFRHALTLFDDIKYGPDFKNFDYVNPAAPKGGKVRLSVVGIIRQFEPLYFQGDPTGVAGNETLLTSSLDEPSTEYGLIAESVWFPEDWSSVVYRLRPEARFHDGKPMTPGRCDLEHDRRCGNHIPSTMPITRMSRRPKRPANTKSLSHFPRKAIANCL